MYESIQVSQQHKYEIQLGLWPMTQRQKVQYARKTISRALSPILEYFLMSTLGPVPDLFTSYICPTVVSLGYQSNFSTVR